ncbi:hypothetical protein [Shewanella chilikensis]|uniref:hypothetical protein n=1 Tax=Shewanella chilikensis TaxID=558541 RepID=UPI001F235B3C|nr:hypothetical protein [Shewanella chilikensis]MCE9786125.1 hypothetical protein [Shewanella chilikensis]
MPSNTKAWLSKALQFGGGCFYLLLASWSLFHVAGWVGTLPDHSEHCQESILLSSWSPNKDWQADVSFSNCSLHGHKHWQSHLSLTYLESGRQFPGLLVVSGRHDELKLDWYNHRHLSISGLPIDHLEHFQQPLGTEIVLTLKGD